MKKSLNNLKVSKNVVFTILVVSLIVMSLVFSLSNINNIRFAQHIKRIGANDLELLFEQIHFYYAHNMTYPENMKQLKKFNELNGYFYHNAIENMDIDDFVLKETADSIIVYWKGFDGDDDELKRNYDITTGCILLHLLRSGDVLLLNFEKYQFCTHWRNNGRNLLGSFQRNGVITQLDTRDSLDKQIHKIIYNLIKLSSDEHAHLQKPPFEYKIFVVIGSEEISLKGCVDGDLVEFLIPDGVAKDIKNFMSTNNLTFFFYTFHLPTYTYPFLKKKYPNHITNQQQWARKDTEKLTLE